jgi:hypothetical protein
MTARRAGGVRILSRGTDERRSSLQAIVFVLSRLRRYSYSYSKTSGKNADIIIPRKFLVLPGDW